MGHTREAPSDAASAATSACRAPPSNPAIPIVAIAPRTDSSARAASSMRGTRRIHAVRPAGGGSKSLRASTITVQRVDPEGAIVWKLTNDDFTNKPLADPCGAQRLPNGNIVIASYGAKGEDQIKMFEVTPEKKIVWSQTKFKAHHFQILTTNGKPIEGEPMR